MRSSNPIFNNNSFAQEGVLTEMPMTVNGTLNKLFLLSSVFALSAAIIWYNVALGHTDLVALLLPISLIIGFVLALIISIVPKTAPYLSPFYAIAQGVALSTISCYFEAMYPGVVVKAVMATFITIFVMLFCYKSQIIRATSTFRKVMLIGTASIAIFYLISFVAISLFNASIPYFNNSNDLPSIIVNIVFVCFAALNLIIDFDFIENGSNRLLPKTFEWYGAFGLILTVFWIYIEFLRLFARFSSRK